MKISNARRLHIILEHHASTSSPDQLKNIMIRLMSFHKVQPKTSDESLSKCYYRQLRSVKEFLFGSKHTQTKQYDSFLAKKPVFLLISSWFFEFNSKSNIIFTDFISQIVSVGSSLENGSEVMDISVLLYSYFTACKDINTTEEGVLHIFDIIGAINNAVKQSLERDDQNDLCTILAIAQIALEHMHTSVGYTYASWFESLFIKRSSTILDKRMSTVFIKTLQQMILYEIPSVLQIHGRALLDCTTIPNSQLYVSSARKRLLELGVDRHLKSYPISLKTPLRLDIITDDNSGEGDEVGEIIQQFMQKDNTVPVSLLHAHVFKKQWFMSTFLPTLLDWKGRNVEARDKLIIALRKMNKVPDNLYKSFVQQQKQKKIA
ncbi:hypothetical protein BD408DRAFT_158878 [Parasitella parasitica]|nr:hypothetical protein BD408DRAFT_158878 [Parasitella parasitica]